MMDTSLKSVRNTVENGQREPLPTEDSRLAKNMLFQQCTVRRHRCLLLSPVVKLIMKHLSNLNFDWNSDQSQFLISVYLVAAWI